MDVQLIKRFIAIMTVMLIFYFSEKYEFWLLTDVIAYGLCGFLWLTIFLHLCIYRNLGVARQLNIEVFNREITRYRKMLNGCGAEFMSALFWWSFVYWYGYDVTAVLGVIGVIMFYLIICVKVKTYE